MSQSTTPQATIYLDYQATTPTDPRVLEEMIPYFAEKFGNPHSSDHLHGWEANNAVEDARRTIATFFGCDSNEVFFTSGATESNNLAILGCLRGIDQQRRKRVLISQIEHKSVLEVARYAENLGFIIDTLPVDISGRLDVDSLQTYLKEDVALLSIMTINNEVGSVQDINKISEMCKSTGVLFHTDAAQAPTTLDMNVHLSGVDLMSISGHKVYGPKGIGVIFIKHSAQRLIKPILFGGDQESGIRPGTLPTPLCVGLAAALRIVQATSATERTMVRKHRDKLFSLLKTRIPNIELTGPPLEERHIGNLNIHFPDVEAQLLIGMMQPHVAASSGSACTSGTPGPSHVLLAMGYTAEFAQKCIRFSVGRFTTEEEIERAATIIADTYDAAL